MRSAHFLDIGFDQPSATTYGNESAKYTSLGAALAFTPDLVLDAGSTFLLRCHHIDGRLHGLYARWLECKLFRLVRRRDTV